jgi:hypothetical protein
MATTPESKHKMQPRESEDKPENGGNLRRERLAAIALLLVIAAIFGFVLWLASLAPESTGGTDLEYYFMP